MDPVKGIVVVRQAGSAGGVMPAVQSLLDEIQPITIVVIAFLQAVATCREVVEDLSRFDFRVVTDEVAAIAILEREIEGAAFLLTGTSSEAAADAVYWRVARARRVGSTAYLDQWSNIEKRFPGMSRDDWPDVLAVIDEHDKKMAEALAPAGVSVRITGSPAIERITAAFQALRARGVSSDEMRLVFASEPVEDEAEYRRINGFADDDSFSLAIELMREHHPHAVLVLRLHPRDSRERWLRSIPADIAFEWDSDNRAECLARAGRVFGMRSFFLQEAWACGVKVYSLQPHRRTECPLTDGRMPVITSAKEYCP